MPSAPIASLAATMKNQDNFTQSSLPVSVLKRGELLFLAEESQGGLILQKPFYADFVGPGAAIGGHCDASCIAIFQLGVVNLRVPDTLAEREQACLHRMSYSDTLAHLVRIDEPLHRATALIDQLCRWVGPREARMIPLEVVARLAGLLPKTVMLAWNRRAGKTPILEPDLSRLAS